MRRSMLFLPGNTPNIIQNGEILGADAVILDLEDAVAPTEKDSARILVRNAREMNLYDYILIDAPAGIGRGFAETKAQLKAMGFDNYYYYENRKAVAVKL